jgi:hypothetical protein
VPVNAQVIVLRALALATAYLTRLHSTMTHKILANLQANLSFIKGLAFVVLTKVL